MRFVQLRHLLDGQPFGEGEPLRVDLAADEHLHHVERRHRVIEAILARLQIASLRRPPERDAEQARVADDVRVGKRAADFAARRALTNDDELFGGVVAFVGLMDAVPAAPRRQRNPRGDEHEDEQHDGECSTHGCQDSPAG